MKICKLYTPLMIAMVLVFVLANFANAQSFKYKDSGSHQPFEVAAADNDRVAVNYSIQEFSLEPIMVNREEMLNLIMPGNFLPNDEGKPNLPGSGRYIAIPQGATPVLHIKSSRIEVIKDINLVPAPRIPLDTEDAKLSYQKDTETYSRDAFYPAKPVSLSGQTKLRGVDVVMLGITPFQYNRIESLPRS
jgi:peptidase C25-like protein